MNIEIFKFFFLRKNSFITLFLIVIHQVFIAASIYFLTQLINDFQLGKEIFNNLVLYLLCMIFPYFPGLISYVFLQKWINNIHFCYVEEIVKSNIFSPLESMSSEKKDHIDSIVARNSFSTVSSYLYFIHDFFTLILNSILSLVVVGFLLSEELILGYVLSAFFSFLLILLTYKKIYNLSTLSESKFIDYGVILLKMWDNLSLHNGRNKDEWFSLFYKKSNDYYDVILKTQLIKQIINLSIAFIALMPTSYLVYQILMNDNTQKIIIAAIIVNLTRIFSILSSLNSLLHSCIDFSAMNARLSVLFSFRKFKNSNPNNDFSGRGVKINNLLVERGDDVISMIRNNEKGRFLITGRNGSGKSTLLFFIKNIFLHKSVLVPVMNHNILWGIDTKNLSSGQQAINILKEVKNMNENIILLDEWDANLDTNNKEMIDNMIDEMSKSKIIVEVRHRVIEDL